jgi:hypothetical protein
MSESNALSTILLSGVVSLVVAGLTAGITTFATFQVTKMELAEKQYELALQRRNERRENYQTVINLLTDFEWRSGDHKYDEQVVELFTLPFVRAANRVRVYGSPACIAALDEIQGGFGKLNRAKGESERVAATRQIHAGLDHLVINAREDVGPRKEDKLREVHFEPGAGPSAL